MTTGLVEIPLEEIETLQSSIARIQTRLGSRTREDEREEYLRILKRAQENGWKPKAAEIRFKQRFGYWPPKSWRPAA